MTEQIEFIEPSFLSDLSNELLKHEKIATKNQKVILKTVEQYYGKLHQLLDSAHWDRHSGELLANAKKLMREKEISESKISKAEELCSAVHFECNTLGPLISEKKNDVLVASEALEQLEIEVNHIEEDNENKKKELALKHQSVLLTKDEYKKLLGCHIRLLNSDENESVYVLTFESIVLRDTNSMPKNSVKLLHSSDGSWKLLETNPEIPNLKQLSQKLNESQDVRGLLSYLRKALTK